MWLIASYLLGWLVAVALENFLIFHFVRQDLVSTEPHSFLFSQQHSTSSLVSCASVGSIIAGVTIRYFKKISFIQMFDGLIVHYPNFLSPLGPLLILHCSCSA